MSIRSTAGLWVRQAPGAKPHEVGAVIRSGLRIAGWQCVLAQPGEEHDEVVFEAGVRKDIFAGGDTHLETTRLTSCLSKASYALAVAAKQ